MNSYEKWHWRVLTVAARLFGLMAVVVAIAFFASSMMLAGVMVALIGIPFLFVRPFRPDLGDTSPVVDPIGVRGNSKRRRRWWTGDEC
jgi:hypothetical protein